MVKRNQPPGEHGGEQPADETVRAQHDDGAQRRGQQERTPHVDRGRPEGRDVPPPDAKRDKKSPWLGGG